MSAESASESTAVGATPDNQQPGEFRCPECNCQVTRSPTDPSIEYGHANTGNRRTTRGERCSRRPASVDSTRSKANDGGKGRDEHGRFAEGGL